MPRIAFEPTLFWGRNPLRNFATDKKEFGMVGERISRRVRIAWVSLLAPVMVLLSACEDGGNGGNDNLLTGGSLVVLVVIGIVVFLVMRSKK